MTAQETKKPNKNFFFLLVVLAIVIILEAVVVVYKTKQKKVTPLPKVIKNVIPGIKAKGNLQFVLDANQTVKPNQNIKAQLAFESPNEPVANVDAVLTFNPQLISVVEITGNKDLFEQIIVNRQEIQTGRIKITAYMPKKTILGKYTLAYFTVKLLKDQPAVLDIEFLGPDRVTDSNVVSQKTQLDILGSVLSLKLTPETR